MRRTLRCSVDCLIIRGCLSPLLLPLALLLGSDLPAAREAWEGGRYEGCVLLLAEAATRDEHLYAGLCHFALGQPGDAARHFTSALDLDVEAQLPAFSSPKVAAFFRELKDQRPRPVPDFASAVGLFEGGDLAGAELQLRVIRQAPLARAEQVRVHLLEGALKLEQGSLFEADVALRAALALEPGARFPFRASASARARLEQLGVPTGRPVWPRVVVPAAGGAALLVTGAVLYGLARQGADELRVGDPTIHDLDGLARKTDAIRSLQTAGFLLGGTGLAALATAGLLWLLGREDSVSLVVTGQGVGVVWSTALR